MGENISTNDEVIWNRLVKAYYEFNTTSSRFLENDVDRVSLLRKAFYNQDFFPAIYFLRYLKIEELLELFNDLVYLLLMRDSAYDAVFDAILKLPLEWVVANIEAVAGPLIAEGSYVEYRKLLGLYIKLDRGLTLGLATRAAQHSDYDIREAGEDFLHLLKE